MSKAKNRWIALVACLAAFGLGCEGFGKQMREHTYPRDFRYAEPEEIRGVMQQLADRVGALDDELEKPEPDPQATAYLLDQMLTEIEKLRRGGWPANHPGFGPHAEQFATEIRRAKRDVERDPPNFFWASTISGACLRCHGEDPAYASHPGEATGAATRTHRAPLAIDGS